MIVLLFWFASLRGCGFGVGPCCIAEDGHIEDYDGYHWMAPEAAARECI